MAMIMAAGMVIGNEADEGHSEDSMKMDEWPECTKCGRDHFHIQLEASGWASNIS